jgi:hypothetical protein
VRRTLVALAIVTGCGDSHAVATEIDSVSGTRLKLELYLFEDGTQQVEPSSFYDTTLHAQCSPQRWGDEERRCVPEATEVRFTDSECRDAVGFAPSTDRRPPTHFLAYDVIDGGFVPMQLYRAGARTVDATQVYVRRGDACLGPELPPSDSVTYAATDELPAQSMQIVSEHELGAGRLGLQVQESNDGLRVLGGLLDRDLGQACSPISRDATTSWCEPATSQPATVYLDDSCTGTMAVLTFGDAAPAIARSVDGDGCARFTALDPEVTYPVYRLDGSSCVRTFLTGDAHVFPLGEAIEVPRFERSVEAAPGRRLQRVMLAATDDPDLRFASDRLYDLATRGECRREHIRDDVRCMPVATVQATTLYGAGCGVPITVALRPARTCGDTVSFARAFASDGVTPTLRAIGDAPTATLFTFTGAGCVVYTPPPGTEVRALGPPLPPETFSVAVKYGAR